MTRTAVVDRPDFHAWRAYRAVVDAESAAVQVAVYHFASEGRGRHGIRIHGGPTTGVRIGAVLTTTVEYSDPASGATRRRRTYTAVADAMVATERPACSRRSSRAWSRAAPLRPCGETCGGSLRR